MQCIIDGISHKGEGVARIQGKATFVPFTIPGEKVEVTIIEEKKSFQRAKLEKVIDASPDRIEPACRYYYDCGGCSYQHMNYSRQLELKRQVVKDSLKRIGGLDLEVNQVMGMEKPWHYRNKVEWHVGRADGRLTMGYYINDSHVLVGIDDCLLISPEMQAYSKYIKEHLQELKIPEGCEVILRQSAANQELMLILEGDGSSGTDFARILNYREVSSIYSVEKGVARLHYGDQTLQESIANRKYQVSPLAFFQVNHEQTEKMMEIIRDYAQLRASDVVLDAYCGTGTIALALAGCARRVVGVESFKASIKDAKRNAFNNNTTNCQFIKGDCEKIVPNLDEHFNLVILDPPRTGCKAELINAVAKLSPEQVIYVSCNPATLARDLKILLPSGYLVEAVQPIDMFPQTSHVETVVLIERG